MAERIELNISPREVVGKATKRLRKEGIIPANISGHKEESRAVQVQAEEFDNLRRKHGLRSIISLRQSGAKAQTVLVRHIQHNPRNGHIVHIDFSRVSMTERITVRIPLHYIGESQGVKIQDGVLLHLIEALEVECRASDIVDHLDVDISPLTEIDSTLYARDVQLPRNYTLITSPDEPIVKVAAPKVEEEPAAETPEEAPAPAPTAESTEEEAS